MTNDVERYKDETERDDDFRVRPRLRSLISRSSKPIRQTYQDEETGEWRTKIVMSRRKFDDEAKGIFLREYAKWGRMGEAASAAGVTTQTVRKAIEDDEEFAEALLVQEEEYKDKLIGHHQNLVFNGIEKNRFDREGNLIETSVEYPIQLIAMELKKHDRAYRDKQELAVTHGGGVLVAPSEVQSVDDWENRFSKAIDVTPPRDDEEEDDK